MGIFSKLFGRKNSSTSAKNNQNILSATASVNYQVSYNYLRTIFFGLEFPVSAFDGNIDFAKKLVETAVQFGSEQGLLIPSGYYSLPITFVSNQDRSCYGYIVEFDDAKVECDCNYIGMMVKNGEKVYYTSEYYASFNHFSVCCLYANGCRSIGVGHIKPRTFEEFKQAIIG